MEEVGKREEEEEEENIMPPGFRFHPTDEELVGFYLQRMVQNKPLRINLIKQIDIYKYHPWDLPMMSNNEKKNVEGGEIGEAGREREGYFMCKRGRKYRNSERPNRVTTTTTTTTSSSSSCGFWKATGIDKPIYGSSIIIGLKKSLVYYRGTAAKPSKTQWMMHEFRLPNTNAPPEVWTLCRIFKRIPSHQKKCIALLPSPAAAAASTKPNCNQQLLGYHHRDINAMLIPPSPPCLPFNQDSLINIHQNHETKLNHTTPTTNSNNDVGQIKDERNHMFIMGGELGEASPPLESYCYPSFWNPISTSVMSEQDIFASATWDELGSVVHLAMDDPFIKGLLS